MDPPFTEADVEACVLALRHPAVLRTVLCFVMYIIGCHDMLRRVRALRRTAVNLLLLALLIGVWGHHQMVEKCGVSFVRSVQRLNSHTLHFASDNVDIILYAVVTSLDVLEDTLLVYLMPVVLVWFAYKAVSMWLRQAHRRARRSSANAKASASDGVASGADGADGVAFRAGDAEATPSPKLTAAAATPVHINLDYSREPIVLSANVMTFEHVVMGGRRSKAPASRRTHNVSDSDSDSDVDPDAHTCLPRTKK